METLDFFILFLENSFHNFRRLDCHFFPEGEVNFQFFWLDPVLLETPSLRIIADMGMGLILAWKLGYHLCMGTFLMIPQLNPSFGVAEVAILDIAFHCLVLFFFLCCFLG